jgi:hypothetical protein
MSRAIDRREAATAGFDEGTYGGSRWSAWPCRLSWSPDERTLAYGMLRNCGSGAEWISLLDVKTGKERLLAAGAVDPAFSPDGNRIAFTDVCQGRGICLLLPFLLLALLA